MVDRKKVIKGLECCSSLDNNCADCPYNYDGDMGENGCLRLKLIPDAIALLKEQEAKLVLNIADSIAGMEVGDCPWCGRYLANRISDPSKFCKYCGQVVKWE